MVVVHFPCHVSMMIMSTVSGPLEFPHGLLMIEYWMRMQKRFTSKQGVRMGRRARIFGEGMRMRQGARQQRVAEPARRTRSTLLYFCGARSASHYGSPLTSSSTGHPRLRRCRPETRREKVPPSVSAWEHMLRPHAPQQQSRCLRRAHPNQAGTVRPGRARY